MKLQTETKSYIVVDSFVLSEFIALHYGEDYSVAADLEANNDTYEVITVDGKLSEFDYDELSNIVTEGIQSAHTRTLLNDFAARGLIEKGNYLIQISW